MVATNSFAQKSDAKKNTDKASVSIGAEIGLPIGDLKETTSIGIGGSVKAAIPVFEGSAVTVSAGYMTVCGKTITILEQSFKYGSLGMIPIKAGLRFIVSEGFYGEPQLSYTLYSGSVNSGAFSYAANFEYMVNNSFDISARYEATSKNSATLSFIGPRIANSFGM